MQSLSEYIKELKKELKMQENQELAAQMNVGEDRVARWCEGEEMPDDDTCVRLAYIAKGDPANVLILKQLSSATNASREYWEKISIKYQYGRTAPRFLFASQGSSLDRRSNVIQFNGADRRKMNDRRSGDRRLLLAS
jgi:transcriptional regulator with XRE-family HTH domain